MKKNTKIVQINGFRGLFLAFFTVACLCAGFVAFPGYLAKTVWNYAAGFCTFPVINAFQGILLWTIVVISYLIITDKTNRTFISLKSPKELNDEELMQVMSIIKKQSKIQPMIIKAEDLEKFGFDKMAKPVDFVKKCENDENKEEHKKENV